jgi:hypothetical protein
MTLVELLAASALAALLFVALSGVLRSLAIQRRTLLAGKTTEPWRVQLAQQLRWDLANARTMKSRFGELRLVGYGSCDFATGEPTFQRSEIVYFVRNIGKGLWLMRKETHPDDMTLDNYRTDLVCTGVTDLGVIDLEADVNDEGFDDDMLQHSAASDPLQPVPNRLRLVLVGERQGSRMLDEVVLLN